MFLPRSVCWFVCLLADIMDGLEETDPWEKKESIRFFG